MWPVEIHVFAVELDKICVYYLLLYCCKNLTSGEFDYTVDWTNLSVASLVRVVFDQEFSCNSFDSHDTNYCSNNLCVYGFVC